MIDNEHYQYFRQSALNRWLSLREEGLGAELREDVGEEAIGEEGAGRRFIYASGEEVEELLGIHGGGGAAVGAAYAVGENLQPGQGVHGGVLAEHEVEVGEVGIRIMRAEFHANIAAEDGGSVVAEHVFIEQSALGAGGGVSLHRALVEYLLALQVVGREE